jgi:anti-sigma factor RsiW
MSNIEEQLWAYIDGTCTADERQAISLLIAEDNAWREKYQELLALNSEIAAMELEEPSMAFTYNVMETIRAEHASKPLKSAINSTIIKGIGGFFVITILALLVFMLASVNWSAAGGAAPVEFKLPDLSNIISKPVMQGFLFFDVVLALFLFDTLLRRRAVLKHT